MIEESDAILDAIRAEIAENTADAPTVPGLYRMPCGECFVDYWIGPDGVEHWAVPGDPASYTRRTIAIARHGDAGWQRMYTLAEASEMLGTNAERSNGDLPVREGFASRPAELRRGDRMPDENRPLLGEDAAAVGRALVSASLQHDTEIVRDALHAIWVDSVIDAWLVGRNAFLDGARPVDLLAANDLAQVMDAVRQEIQGGYR